MNKIDNKIVCKMCLKSDMENRKIAKLEKCQNCLIDNREIIITVLKELI
jgi:hypothetical protein